MIPWNKGLTKDTDERVRKIGESVSRTTKGRTGRPHTPEDIDKMMKSYSLKINSRKSQGRYKYKYGTICGISCDSGYELAFVAYCLYYGMNIERNTDGFNYIFSGKQHKYYPDFVIDGVYYEIKGVCGDKDVAQIEQFPSDKKLIVIGSCEIKQYIDFCKNKYGEDYELKLYDKNYPCWTDRILDL